MRVPPESVPGPVSEAEDYRRYLLRQLGSDDPETVQAETPAALRELIQGVPQELLKRRPAENEYSVLEIVGHITDAELVLSTRYRWVLAEDQPDLPGYDQDSWVRAIGHQESEPASLLTLFEALRAANLELWKRNPGGRARAGTHRERGEESFELMFRLIAGHDGVHLAQARDTLAAAREGIGSD